MSNSDPFDFDRFIQSEISNHRNGTINSSGSNANANVSTSGNTTSSNGSNANINIHGSVPVQLHPTFTFTPSGTTTVPGQVSNGGNTFSRHRRRNTADFLTLVNRLENENGFSENTSGLRQVENQENRFESPQIPTFERAFMNNGARSTGLISNGSNRQTGADKYHCLEYHWTIEEFGKFLANNEPNLSGIQSPKFDGDGLSKYKWNLVLNPKYRSENGETWISINLHLYRNMLKDSMGMEFAALNNHQFVEATYEIGLEINGKLIEIKETKTFDFQAPRGWNKFCKTPTQVQNDQVVVHCRVWIGCAHIKHENLSSKVGPGQNLGKFQTDFASVMKSGKFSDAEIVVGSGTDIFQVHKVILAGRSNFFQEYFEDSANAKIEVQDFSKEVVEKMIEHIYTGRTDITQDNAKELFQIGKKYSLEDLKSDCENTLVKSLKVENCIEILKFADSEGASLLKSKSIEYIIKNRSAVSLSPDFQEMLDSCHALCSEILKCDYVGLGGVKRLKISHSPTPI